MVASGRQDSIIRCDAPFIVLNNIEQMKKREILENYRLDRIDDNTVFIQNRHFNFAYTKADHVVKDEFKGQYKYFGGLQSDYPEGSEDYKSLEGWLCDIAEMILEYKIVL